VELLFNELLRLFEQEEDREAASLFLNWFRQLRVHGRIIPEDYKLLETTYSLVEEAQTMLIKTMAKEREKVRMEIRQEVSAEGIEQGIERGIEQGIEQKTQEMIVSMHNKGFDLSTIADITNLTEVQVLAFLREEESKN